MFTTQDALDGAQRIFPLDLVQRLDYMIMMRDRTAQDREVWQAAIELTRNGHV